MLRQASDNTVVPAQFAAGVASDTDLPQTENVTSLGQTITIKGDLHAGENVIVNGRIEGTVDLTTLTSHLLPIIWCLSAA